MPQPRLVDIKRRLDTVLEDAAKVYYRALAAAENNTWSDHHAQALTKRVLTISELLACCTDGRWYGMLGEETLEGMLDYTLESEELLMKTAAPNNECRDEQIRTSSDRWLLARRLKIDGVGYQHDIVCTNPAFGFRQLDEWENKLRASLLRVAA